MVPFIEDPWGPKMHPVVDLLDYGGGGAQVFVVQPKDGDDPDESDGVSDHEESDDDESDGAADDESED